MKRLLTREDHGRIAGAIARAEQGTAGEIYCVVARRVATYRWVPISIAAFLALCVLPILAWLGPAPHQWPWLGSGWASGNMTGPDVDSFATRAILLASLLQILVFAVALALTWPVRVRMALTPGVMRRTKVHHTAITQFRAQGLHETVARTGMLLFVALDERQAVLIADDGIHARVHADAWIDIVGELTAAAHEDHLVEGLIAAIERCGALLGEHFPPEAAPVNQLPDRVVEL